MFFWVCVCVAGDIWYLPSGPHGVATQSNSIVILNAVRTSKVTNLIPFSKGREGSRGSVQGDRVNSRVSTVPYLGLHSAVATVRSGMKRAGTGCGSSWRFAC